MNAKNICPDFFFENRNKKFYFLLYFILPCSFNLVTLAMINTNKFQSFIKVSVAFAFYILKNNQQKLYSSGTKWMVDKICYIYCKTNQKSI